MYKLFEMSEIHPLWVGKYTDHKGYTGITYLLVPLYVADSITVFWPAMECEINQFYILIFSFTSYSSIFVYEKFEARKFIFCSALATELTLVVYTLLVAVIVHRKN